MKLKNLGMPESLFLTKNPICDTFTENIFICYCELKKIISSNPNLRDISLSQVSHIYPQSIKNGIVEYRMELHDEPDRYIHLDFVDQDYYSDAIPNAFKGVFGKRIINSDFREQHSNLLYPDDDELY